MRRIKQRLISAVAALSLLVSAIPTVTVQADSLSTDVNEPFYSGVSFTLPNGTSATSSSYRIPAMVTLDNGNIVAAADIRWNTTYDGGGLDTLTARSSDGGVNWDYTVANYLGDNGNTYNGKSSCFIDPCLVVGADGETVYMLVDLYPYGIALNGNGYQSAPTREVGFNSDGHLLLWYGDSTSYTHYLNLDNYYIYTANSEKTDIKVNPDFSYSLPAKTLRMIKPTESTEPTEETTAPTEEIMAPTEETTAPTEETTAPTEETAAPTEETTAPTEETTVPTEETTAPTEETTAPTEENTAPTQETTAPTDPTEEEEVSLRGNFWDGLVIKASAAEYDPDEGVAPAAADTYNLFFENSPYKVARTGYLYLTKSTDGGESWGEPELLNLKTSNEQVCLVGPGRGITTSTGRIVIPIYSYNGGESSQRMGFIYSDNGSDWDRVDSTIGTMWSSESAVVELENGNLRFFFRNGSAKLYYVDYIPNKRSWGNPTSTGISTNSNTQISAITYSKKLDGKQVILVSCPAGPSGGSSQSGASYRTNGRIFVFTDNGSTMTLANTIQVNSGNFMYSCLTERSDGSVAILYEDTETAWGTGGRYEMEMKAYTSTELGVTFGNSGGTDDGGDPEEPTVSQSIVLNVGETKQAEQVIDGNAGTAGTHTTADGVAQYEITHTTGGSHTDSTAKLGADANYTGGSVNLHEALYTFTGDNSNGFIVENDSVYLTIDGNSDAGYPGCATSEKLVFIETTNTVYGSYAFDIKLQNSARYLFFWRDGKNRFDRQSSSAWETAFLVYAPVDDDHISCVELPGYYQITSASQLKSGGQYLITAKYNGVYYVLYPSTETNNYFSHVAKATGTATTCADQTPVTTVTFSGLKPGQTTVSVGSTVYTVTVNAAEANINKHVAPETGTALNPLTDLGLTGSGYTVSYQVTSGTAVSVDSNGNVTAGNDNGTATITATVTKDDILCGTVTYTVNVSAVAVESYQEVYLPVDGQAIISGLTGDVYTDLLDSSIATIRSDSQARAMTLTISGVATGDTQMIVGTTQFNIHVVPKNTDETRENTVKYLYVEIDTIENCDVFYSINGSDLYELDGTGVLIDQTYYGGFNISFYAAPFQGYALTEMATTNSLNEYYTLTYEGDISNCPAWPLAAGGESYKPSPSGFQWALKEGNVTKERLQEIFETAVFEKGCHGGLTFTKNGNGTTTNNPSNGNNLNSKLTFKAEKLPELEKEIIGYKRAETPADEDLANGYLTVAGYTDYFKFDENVSLAFGDSLLYRFTVTCASNNVNYTDIVLQDSKIGYTQTVANNTYDTPGERIYYAEYTISRQDADKYAGGRFVNHAALSYQYTSLYSTGVYGGSASSEATCDIIGIVSYQWEEGTPEAIVRNEGDLYTLPSSFTLLVGDQFQIVEYKGKKNYVENVNGIDVIWSYSGEWGVQRSGSNEKTWFLVETALDNNFTMAQSRSITFYGRWLANYSVVYKWVGEHPDVSPPEIISYQSGAQYTVDNDFYVGYTHNDGNYTWTFQGWTLRGSDEICNGTSQTIGSSHVIYTGSWTKVSNATSLSIYKTGCSAADENQSFLFHISGGDLEMDVVINGNGHVIINGLTVGQTYTVTENTDWSWRYTPANREQTITIGTEGNSLAFANTRSISNWLNGNAWCDNRFDGAN